MNRTFQVPGSSGREIEILVQVTNTVVLLDVGLSARLPREGLYKENKVQDQSMGNLKLVWLWDEDRGEVS